jgi:hypothetical protein
MRTCNTCEAEKPDNAFRKAGRGLSKTCIACEAGIGPDADAAPEPVKLTGHLEVASGLGFRASIEDGTLQLEQDRPGDDDQLYTWTISLAPHEASKLVDWIAEQVQAE